MVSRHVRDRVYVVSWFRVFFFLRVCGRSEPISGPIHSSSSSSILAARESVYSVWKNSTNTPSPLAHPVTFPKITLVLLCYVLLWLDRLIAFSISNFCQVTVHCTGYGKNRDLSKKFWCKLYKNARFRKMIWWWFSDVTWRIKKTFLSCIYLRLVLRFVFCCISLQISLSLSSFDTSF